MIATALVAQHGDELGKASASFVCKLLLSCSCCSWAGCSSGAALNVPGLRAACALLPTLLSKQWVCKTGYACSGSSCQQLKPPPAACLLQVTAVAGSAGGLEATPPSDHATAVLTSPNSTEVEHLALGYPLDTPEGVRCP